MNWLYLGIAIVLIALIGWLVLGHALDVPAMFGLGLMLAGVVVINLFSKSISHG